MELATISFPIFGEGFSLNPPNSVQIFGLDVRLYGAIIALGFILATVYAILRRRSFGLTQDNILDMVICAIPSGIIGARLYYVIFHASEYFGAGKWLNILKIWEGGLAIYGGVIGAFFAILIYSRIKKIHFGKLADVGGLGLLIGQAIGRWGNFVNREVYGAPTDVPWRMVLTDGSETLSVHPAFLYESLWNIIGFVFLHIFSKKRKKYHGQIFLMYVAWYGLGRYFIEGFRDYNDVLKFAGDLRISQLLAALSFVVAVVILVRNYLRDVGFAPETEGAGSDVLVTEDSDSGIPQTEEPDSDVPVTEDSDSDIPQTEEPDSDVPDNAPDALPETDGE